MVKTKKVTEGEGTDVNDDFNTERPRVTRKTTQKV